MWNVVGHDSVINLLTQAVNTSRLAHSYLITGPDHVGKTTLAIQLAAAVNCAEPDPPCNKCSQCARVQSNQHSDINLLSVNEEIGHKSIGIEEVQEAARQCYLKPFEGRNRVIIIENANQLSLEASNALLKILEEPPPQLLLILIAPNPEALLATITSRCQRLNLRIVPEHQIAEALQIRWDTPKKDAEELARRSNGLPGRAIEARINPSILQDQKQRLAELIAIVSGTLEDRLESADNLSKSFVQNRSSVQETLELWALFWHGILMRKYGLRDTDVSDWSTLVTPFNPQSMTDRQVVYAIKKIMTTTEMLNANVNPRLALESLLINLPYPPIDQQS